MGWAYAQPLLFDMRKLLLLLIAGVVMLTSCSKNEDEDDVIILIKTTPDKEYYTSNETVIYEINTFANTGNVNSVNITDVTLLAAHVKGKKKLDD